MPYCCLKALILFTKGTELTIFGQLKIPMFSINLNLKTSRLLNCLHMIFLHCILRYLSKFVSFVYANRDGPDVFTSFCPDQPAQ